MIPTLSLQGTGTLRFLLSLLMATSLPVLASEPAVERVQSERPLVIAHRGYSMVAPENTLVAFNHALLAGADFVELDYYHSKDGVPVVLHDSTLDRTTDAVARWGGANHAPSQRLASELTALDAGKWFKPAIADQRVPTLETALDVIQARGMTLIERKQGDAKTLVNLLREKSLINKLVVQAFDWNFLRDFHQIEPRQVLGALGPPGTRNGRKLSDEEKALNPMWAREVKELGAQLIVWNRQVDAASVRAAQDMGLRVWVYTINDADTANRLLDAGVNGIITDNPAILWRTLALRARQ
jgi:glycerophosphoryl diester phosphodiesterase